MMMDKFPIYFFTEYIICRGQTDEIENLKTRTLPLSSVDKNHFEHQIELSRQDIKKKLEELGAQGDQQTRLAGYTVKDQAIDGMKGRLQSMLEDCDQLSGKLQTHEQLCAEVQAEQVNTFN